MAAAIGQQQPAGARQAGFFLLSSNRLFLIDSLRTMLPVPALVARPTPSQRPK